MNGSKKEDSPDGERAGETTATPRIMPRVSKAGRAQRAVDPKAVQEEEDIERLAKIARYVRERR
jgi:hypothetical protein